MNEIDLSEIIRISKRAGEKILEVYSQEDFSKDVEIKSDNSPITKADKAANEVIVSELARLYPQIPILSEEEKEAPYSVREEWTSFWCVDPLDGTKEFIKRNGQFTVNIALIVDGYPVLGVVYAPVLDIYYCSDEKGAFKIEKGIQSELRVNNKSDNRIAVGSASHAAPEEGELLSKYNVKETISVGSSLKFCMVANGKADIYYRHGPTMEWDTAAGQAVLEGAGGSVSDLNGNRFKYNKEVLRNSSFLCLGFDK
jgi:3'(2'), 5'-bisphosphate nucleotidase